MTWCVVCRAPTEDPSGLCSAACWDGAARQVHAVQEHQRQLRTASRVEGGEPARRAAIADLEQQAAELVRAMGRRAHAHTEPPPPLRRPRPKRRRWLPLSEVLAEVEEEEIAYLE